MELGSEFNLRIENLKQENNTIYDLLKDYDTLFLNSGRSALRLLSETIEKGEVLLPEYICDSVIKCFSEYEIKYYSLNSKLEIDIDDLYNKISKRTKVVYLMHYFGALQPVEVCSKILEQRNQKNFIIIEDTTHSIFSSARTIGDYCISSLRKWFAIPDGGVLYSQKLPESIRVRKLTRNRSINKAYGMILKTLYLDGVINSNSLYREIFVDSEKKIDVNNEILQISSFSEYLLQCNDINHMVTIRRENYVQLFIALSNIGISPICTLKLTECPFTLPIRIKNRDNFRKYLIDHNIFCAVHWPLVNTALNNIEEPRNLSEQIISLPIDQRYSINEINYLINIINEYERISNDASDTSLK